jgi:hypothetical protein
VHEIDAGGGQAGTVLHRRVHPFGGDGSGCAAAGAPACDHLVLDDHQADVLGQIEDLTALDPDLLGIGQVRPAAVAGPLGAVLDGVVRMLDLPQRDAGLALRAARTPTGFAAQGLGGGLRQPVRGGRLRGVPRVLTQPGLQVRDLDPGGRQLDTQLDY